MIEIKYATREIMIGEYPTIQCREDGWVCIVEGRYEGIKCKDDIRFQSKGFDTPTEAAEHMDEFMDNLPRTFVEPWYSKYRSEDPDMDDRMNPYTNESENDHGRDVRITIDGKEVLGIGKGDENPYHARAGC